MIVLRSYNAHELFLELVSLYSLLKKREIYEVEIELPDNHAIRDLKLKLKENNKFSLIGNVVVLK